MNTKVTDSSVVRDAELFRHAVRKGLIALRTSSTNPHDPMRCSWMEGRGKSCDISNNAYDGVMQQKEQATPTEDQAKLLADALASCILASGIVRKDVDGLTGPQLLLFAEDLRKMLESRAAQPTAQQDAQAAVRGGDPVTITRLAALVDKETRQVLKDSLDLIEQIKYMVGIAERGTGKKCPDDERPEAFLLAYVKSLEEAVAQRNEQPVPQGFEWPKPPPRKGQSPVLFDDGYEEGWAKCIDTIRAMLVPSVVQQDAQGQKHRPDSQWYANMIQNTLDDDFVIGPPPTLQQGTQVAENLDKGEVFIVGDLTMRYILNPIGMTSLHDMQAFFDRLETFLVESETERTPAAFVSPEQFFAVRDPYGEAGAYLPVRKTSVGKFTMPLYAGRIPEKCQGTNCGAKDGQEHSPECIAETAEAQGWGSTPEDSKAKPRPTLESSNGQVADRDELIDRLVAISSAVAEQDDRKAQGLLRETLRMLNTQQYVGALLTDERIMQFLAPWHVHGDLSDREDLIRSVRAMLASLSEQQDAQAAQCQGSPGECNHNEACMYACGSEPPPPPAPQAEEAPPPSWHCTASQPPDAEVAKAAALNLSIWLGMAIHANVPDGLKQAISDWYDAAMPVAPGAQDIALAAMNRAIDALETAKNGLQWYRDYNPKAVNGSDDEVDQDIDTSISYLRRAIDALHQPQGEATGKKCYRKVYKNSEEHGQYLSARFSDKTSRSFAYDGHRWAYVHTHFDDQGDYDLIYRVVEG